PFVREKCSRRSWEDLHRYCACQFRACRPVVPPIPASMVNSCHWASLDSCMLYPRMISRESSPCATCDLFTSCRDRDPLTWLPSSATLTSSNVIILNGEQQNERRRPWKSKTTGQMQIYEYEAKELLSRYCLAVPQGDVGPQI